MGGRRVAKRPVRQAGGVVIRRRDGSVQVLLITARSRPKQWIIPKGHIEDRETAPAAALREAEEEAGVRGQLLGYLGRFSFPYGKRRVVVRCYLIKARGRASAREGRKHRWYSFDDAVRRISFEELGTLLGRHARTILAGGGKG
jgi:8-oxo-dGTP pyrophosphatase MutT (NUDIX family)